MLDLKFIRENLKIVKKAIKDKHEKVNLNRLIALDEERRELVVKVDRLKHTRNVVSKEIGRLKSKGEDMSQKVAEMRKLGGEIEELDNKIRGLEKKVYDILTMVPNIPHDSVPTGTEKKNIIVSEWGSERSFDFEPLPHWELGSALDILDFAAGSKISGSNFPIYKGAGAGIERALINFMLDAHIKNGYKEIFPPFLVNRDSMFGTGQLPKLEEDMYICEVDDLFLNPTAEVPLINIHRNEILKGENLPIKYVGYTACFRREAGSYGKETRGLLRVHQFNKVELIKFTTPETSYEELETLLSDATRILQQLEIPYRVSLLASGEMSFASAKTYDIEVWAPGVKKWLEVSSVSNCTDFQARRAGIRFRRKKGEKAEFVHILNGSGVATPRTLTAILEHYQNRDGSITIPKVLRPYMNGAAKIKH